MVEKQKGYTSTTTPQIYVQSLQVELLDKEEAIVEFTVVDTPSAENLHGQNEQLCRNLNSFIICYDVTDASSYSAVHIWHNLVRESFGPAYEKKIPPFVSGALVANRIVSSNDTVASYPRVITEHQGRELATSLNLQYFEVGPMSLEVCKEPFEHFAKQFVQSYETHLGTLG